MRGNQLEQQVNALRRRERGVLLVVGPIGFREAGKDSELSLSQDCKGSMQPWPARSAQWSCGLEAGFGGIAAVGTGV
jgi:hypothetical protein